MAFKFLVRARALTLRNLWLLNTGFIDLVHARMTFMAWEFIVGIGTFKTR
jgi:hypothetical protein